MKYFIFFADHSTTVAERSAKTMKYFIPGPDRSLYETEVILIMCVLKDDQNAYG